MKTPYLLLLIWLSVASTAWSQTPAASTAVPTERLLQPDAGSHRSLTEQEIGSDRFFSHETASTLDTDGSGTVTLFEFGDALQKRIHRWMSSPNAAKMSRAVPPTPRMKAGVPAGSIVHQTETNGGMSREQYESLRMRQMNEAGSLPSVAPNIIEKRF